MYFDYSELSVTCPPISFGNKVQFNSMHGLLNDYREPVRLMFHYDIFVYYTACSAGTPLKFLSISCGMTIWLVDRDEGECQLQF